MTVALLHIFSNMRKHNYCEYIYETTAAVVLTARSQHVHSKPTAWQQDTNVIWQHHPEY